MRVARPLSNGHQVAFGTQVLDREVHGKHVRLSLGHTRTEVVSSRRLALQGSVIDTVDRQQGIECGEEVVIEYLEGVS